MSNNPPSTNQTPQRPVPPDIYTPPIVKIEESVNNLPK
jgi:hypothetical protein